jgi:hypothetical protein
MALIFVLLFGKQHFSLAFVAVFEGQLLKLGDVLLKRLLEFVVSGSQFTYDSSRNSQLV